MTVLYAEHTGSISLTCSRSHHRQVRDQKEMTVAVVDKIESKVYESSGTCRTLSARHLVDVLRLPPMSVHTTDDASIQDCLSLFGSLLD